jgi:hypothetical protein
VSVSLVSPLVSALETVESSWGVFDCARLATATEMAATGCHCAECGVHMTAKVGGGVVAGTMVGYRADAAAEWGWNGPWCYECDKAHAMADGY